MTKLWVPGGAGMLGRAVVQVALQQGHAVVVTGRGVDIADESSVAAFVAAERPNWIINCAAYTQVDQAEREPELAHRLNADAPGVMGRVAARSGAFVVHVSTDYVFDGNSTVPWRVTDTPRPVSVYGASKLAGEQQLLAATAGACSIVRTSWLYGSGGKNFVATMLKLMAERDELRVVADQVGRPTSTSTLAGGLLAIAKTGTNGVIHASDDGPPVSWHGFAEAIRDQAIRLGMPMRTHTVHAITTADYPTPARRPAYSVFDLESYRAVAGPLEPWLQPLIQTMANWDKTAR
jgi:dTDP-4-dehydrorhamnose reductase